MNKSSLAALLFAASALLAAAEETPLPASASINLPPPAKEGGMTLNEAISKRRTQRDFKPEALSRQELSDLCYAAFGISAWSPGLAPKRTIPTALNKQDLVIYVLLPEGAAQYDASVIRKIMTDGTSREYMLHGLTFVSPQDLRKYATKRPGMGEAGSCAVVICGDKSKWAENKAGEKYMYVHAGAAMQNLYLAAAAQNLSTVVCGSFDNEPLRKGLNLPENLEILLVQIIGKPQK